MNVETLRFDAITVFEHCAKCPYSQPAAPDESHSQKNAANFASDSVCRAALGTEQIYCAFP